MAAQTMISMNVTASRPFVSTASRSSRSDVLGSRVHRSAGFVARGAGDNSAPETKGVTWSAAARWPPQPLTEHGQPRPEDDPQNYKGTAPFQEYKGPGDVDKMRKEVRERNPFSKKQEGGTQMGGGGEGSAS